MLLLPAISAALPADQSSCVANIYDVTAIQASQRLLQNIGRWRKLFTVDIIKGLETKPLRQQKYGSFKTCASQGSHPPLLNKGLNSGNAIYYMFNGGLFFPIASM